MIFHNEAPFCFKFLFKINTHYTTKIYKVVLLVALGSNKKKKGITKNSLSLIVEFLG